MNVYVQIFIILVTSTILGIAGNTLNPNSIRWTGRIVSASDHAAGNMVALDEAHELFTSKTVRFIDARFTPAYESGHIPGAVSLPFDSFDRYYPELDHMISPNDLIIIYCSGPDCHFSSHLAETMKATGYTNALILKSGFDAWKNAGFPVEKEPAN